jgi:4'-phosphopantetheinyl transferase
VLEKRSTGRPEFEKLLQVESIVDLWIASYDTTAASSRNYHELLSHDELERANRFKFDHLTDFYTFCRGSLRRILSRYLATSPQDIQFAYGNMGKPSLTKELTIEFNVSHSGDLFVCAVTSGQLVGVDVELIRPLRDIPSIAKNFFSPAEQSHLVDLDEEHRTLAFYECWTRKEAVIKATGQGLSRPLDSFDVAFGPGVAPKLNRLDDDHAPSWQMHSFEPRPGYAGAIASPLSWQTLRLFEE